MPGDEFGPFYYSRAVGGRAAAGDGRWREEEVVDMGGGGRWDWWGGCGGFDWGGNLKVGEE